MPLKSHLHAYILQQGKEYVQYLVFVCFVASEEVICRRKGVCCDCDQIRFCKCVICVLDTSECTQDVVCGFADHDYN